MKSLGTIPSPSIKSFVIKSSQKQEISPNVQNISISHDEKLCRDIKTNIRNQVFKKANKNTVVIFNNSLGEAKKWGKVLQRGVTGL